MFGVERADTVGGKIPLAGTPVCTQAVSPVWQWSTWVSAWLVRAVPSHLTAPRGRG